MSFPGMQFTRHPHWLTCSLWERQAGPHLRRWSESWYGLRLIYTVRLQSYTRLYRGLYTCVVLHLIFLSWLCFRPRPQPLMLIYSSSLARHLCVAWILLLRPLVMLDFIIQLMASNFFLCLGSDSYLWILYWLFTARIVCVFQQQSMNT